MAAYGYCRVSTARQASEGESLDVQRRQIEGYAHMHGLTLRGVTVEEGVSGSIPVHERPKGGPLFAKLKKGDVVIAPKLDRLFRSALDALQTIAEFKRRKIGLWLLHLGNDCSGNGISELIMTVLAAVAQFERGLISERIKDAKRNLRRAGRHQGGGRPFGWRFGEANGHGRARGLIPDPEEQAAIADIIAMRSDGKSLMAIRDAMRARGFPISHQLVAHTLQRYAADAAGVVA